MEQKTGRLAHLPDIDAAIFNRQFSHPQMHRDGIKYMTRSPEKKNMRPFRNVLPWEFRGFV